LIGSGKRSSMPTAATESFCRRRGNMR
jgi:hypothetical protein